MAPAPRHIVLIGPMGVGKTTLGRLLADQLSLEFRDSDVWIESMAGRTGAEIAEADGIAELHRLELLAFERRCHVWWPQPRASSMRNAAGSC